jgi:hypothetical protein
MSGDDVKCAFPEESVLECEKVQHPVFAGWLADLIISGGEYLPGCNQCQCLANSRPISQNQLARMPNTSSKNKKTTFGLSSAERK